MRPTTMLKMYSKKIYLLLWKLLHVFACCDDSDAKSIPVCDEAQATDLIPLVILFQTGDIMASL